MPNYILSESFKDFLSTHFKNWSEDAINNFREGRIPLEKATDVKTAHEHFAQMLRKAASIGRGDIINELFHYVEVLEEMDWKKQGHKGAPQELSKRWINKEKWMNSGDKNGNTALMIAAYFGHTEAFLILAATGGNIHQFNKDGNTALAIAFIKKQDALLKAFFALKISIPYYETDHEINQTFLSSTPRANSIFEAAYKKGQFAFAKLLVNNGLDLNAPLRNPLIFAILDKDFGLATLLLNCGANPNQRMKGEHPIFYLFTLDEVSCNEAIKFLLSRGLNPLNTLINAISIHSRYYLPLSPPVPDLLALTSNAENIILNHIKALVPACPDINAIDKETNMTALATATQNINASVINILIEVGKTPKQGTLNVLNVKVAKVAFAEDFSLTEAVFMSNLKGIEEQLIQLQKDLENEKQRPRSNTPSYMFDENYISPTEQIVGKICKNLNLQKRGSEVLFLLTRRLMHETTTLAVPLCHIVTQYAIPIKEEPSESEKYKMHF